MTCVTLLCALWSGSVAALAFLAVLVIAPPLSALAAAVSVKGLSASLTGRYSGESGEDMEIRLVLSSGFFCLSGRLRAVLTSRNLVFGTEEEKIMAPVPPVRGERAFEAPFDSFECGSREIRVKSLALTDMLGLFSFPMEGGQSFVCTVYPFEGQIHARLKQHIDREQPGEIYDSKKSGMDVSEVFGLREYQEGDSLQSIHWKLSAKTDSLIVREFGRPINYHTLIFVSPALKNGQGEISKEVRCGVFDLTISLSRALWENGIAHFVGYLDGGRFVCLPVESESSYRDMTTRLMSCPVPEESGGALYSLLDMRLEGRFTKMIYISADVPGEAAHHMASVMSLTVLRPSEGDRLLFDDSAYEVISIPAAEIREKSHLITL